MNFHQFESGNASSSIYHKLETKIIHWASFQPDIRAVLRYGSRARPDQTVDRYSDLDLVVFSTTPEKFLGDSSWLSSISDFWLATLEHTGAGDPEWIVLFEASAKVDLILIRIGAEVSLHQILEESAYKKAFDRGVQILYVSEDFPYELSQEASESVKKLKPSTPDFVNAVDRALLSTVRTAMMLERGDLWRCQLLLNGELRMRLLVLAEIHTQEVVGPDIDTWYDGRFIEEWADPKIYQYLSQTFANFDKASIRRALSAANQLIIRLASETSSATGSSFPTTGQELTLKWLQEMIIS